MAASPDFEPFLERDVEGIRAALREFRRTHSSDDLFLSVARFAVLAYAPSLHSKHALLAALSAYELRDELGERWDALLAECAIYAAESRQPWSEPPILDPPAVDESQVVAKDELRAAIAERNRLRGERWLASRLDAPELAGDLFDVASDEFEDSDDLIVTTASWQLSHILGAKGRFAALRVPVWEMTASPAPRYEASGEVLDEGELLEAIIDRIVSERGSPVAMRLLFLFDAAVDGAKFSGHDSVRLRTFDFLRSALREGEADELVDLHVDSSASEPVYALARDYGACLKAHAVAARWRSVNPRIGEVVAAARMNLAEGTPHDDMPFA